MTKQLLLENGTHRCATRTTRSNLTATIALCFRDVCGYSCKDVQTSRLTVRSCRPAWSLLDRHTCKDLQSARWPSPPLDQSFGGCGPNFTQSESVIFPASSGDESPSNMSKVQDTDTALSLSHSSWVARPWWTRFWLLPLHRVQGFADMAAKTYNQQGR